MSSGARVVNYRNAIRATLWIGGVFAVVCGLALCLWALLALAGDFSGAVVARVLALVSGIVVALNLVVLVVLLARLQLQMLESEESDLS